MDNGHQLQPPWHVLVPRLLVLSASATLVAGVKGLWKPSPSWHDVSALLFDVAGLIVLEHPETPPTAQLYYSLARVFGVITAALGILYIVMGVYRESAERLRLRLTRLAGRNRNDLVVVCGLGQTGMQLIRDLRGEDGEKGRTVIAIETDPDNPRIQGSRDRGAAVIVGDARDVAVRRRASIDTAEAVFVVCGDDATNVEIVSGIAQQVQDAGRRPARHLRCYTNIASPALAHATRGDPSLARDTAALHLDVFDVIENAARGLVKYELARAYAPGIDEVAHYIIVGFGAVGQAVALQIARLGNFENSRRARMTIVDDWGDVRMQKRRDGFLDRFPAFCPGPTGFDLTGHVRSLNVSKDGWAYRAGRPMHGGWRIDPAEGSIAVEYVVNGEFLDLRSEVDAPGLIERLAARVSEEQQPRVKPCLAVCFDDDRRNLESALRLSAAFARERTHIPIFAYLPNEPRLSTLLTRTREADGTGGPVVFGRREISASYEELTRPTVIELAEVFRAKYLSGGHAPSEAADGRAGDRSFLRSDQDAAHHVDVKLAAVERLRAAQHGTPVAQQPAVAVFSAYERERLAIMEHNRYMAERLLDGWRYGPRNDVAKRRPSLCPWEDLPPEERKKDFDQIEALSAWLSTRALSGR
jgi:voltage-gated potassium channel Kch